MDFTPFIEHLGYLGYKTRVEEEENVSLLFAESTTKANFNISRVGDLTFMVARSNWSMSKTPENIYEIMNTLNEKAVNVSSVWFYKSPDDKPTLGISSAYYGEYNKEIFTAFLDAFIADITRVLAREETKALS